LNTNTVLTSGTDSATGFVGTAFGLSVHQELSLPVGQCGLTPSEALCSAMATTARRFSLTDRRRLAEGLRAYVLMVKGDPTANIGCTINIAGIWRGGVALDN
jgi:imidazolonepropionase-like amidohydrolase